jgi:predicted O-methyltransferase YrrM
VRVLPVLEPRLGFLFPPLAGGRWGAGRTGTYDEWTVIHDPERDASRPNAELVRLMCAAASRAIDIDLAPIAERARRDGERAQIIEWPGHHYRFLAGLTDELGATAVVEVGTYTGASALTFADRPTVRSVTTFDIVPRQQIPYSMFDDSDFVDSGGIIEQRLADLQDPEAFEREAKVLSDADLIFVDGPKDAVFEKRFLDLLLSMPRSRRQCLVIDDVKVNTMVDIWQRFPVAKIDASSVGHWSGTGLVLLEPTQ